MQQPVFDADPSGAVALGDLPTWDLSDLYTSPEAPELKRDIDWLEEACARFADDFEGKLAGLDAHGLLDAVLRYERIDMVAGRITMEWVITDEVAIWKQILANDAA